MLDLIKSGLVYDSLLGDRCRDYLELISDLVYFCFLITPLPLRGLLSTVRHLIFFMSYNISFAT